MPDKGKAVSEWLARGDNDVQTARLAFRASAPTGTIAILIQQAAEKYLKGYLLSRGWRLKKTHDLRELVDRAIEYDATFNDYLDMARRLTAYYLEDRYPPGPPADYPREEIAEILAQAERLIARIREAVG
ncbi:MAG: HEPN domain-containing protein [Chloroflexi bacterium]|nr:HEPN domain-containing protein [Chloroflexota bacterium]